MAIRRDLSATHGSASIWIFVLDSTLQRSGSRIRIIVRLLDVRAGGKVTWVRRFDRELDDVLTLQGEIAAETAAQIDPELLLREGEAPRLARAARANRLQPHSARHTRDLSARAIRLPGGRRNV